MKEFYATITFKQDEQTTVYKKQKVTLHLRGNVSLYTFTLQNMPYKLAIYKDKVNIYAKNSLRYTLKLQLNQLVENYIQSAYGTMYLSAKLFTLNYTKEKDTVQVEYYLDFAGLKQFFYLLIQEEWG